MPSEIPPAPWHSTVDVLFWGHRATPAARGVLPAQLMSRAGAPLTTGGLLSYREGPVGPYDEVFGSPVMLGGALLLSHVPFVAVSSEASIRGGRRNWALPKELAQFDGAVGRPGVVTARGDGWALRVTTTARRHRFAVWMPIRAAQVWPDGQVREFSAQIRGTARLARVDVEHLITSPLGDWLAEGRHMAMLISGTQDVWPARP